MSLPEGTEKELDIQDRDTYLEVRFLEEFSIARFKRQAEAASAVCRDRKNKKMLVDISTITAQLTTMERFDLASHAVRVSAGLKVALLVNPTFLDPGKFGIVVAQNRGLTVDAFTVRQRAVDWLQAGDPD
jgi:hypothetical protein